MGHVHDRDPARRDRLCGDLDARPLNDLDTLAGLDVAGAVVCSETVHHEADIPAALAAGVPVFSEKPLAGSARAAHCLAEQAEESGVLLHTGYFLRTIPALQTARDWITRGRLGVVTEARMRFSHDGGYADWLDLDCWMTDPGRACYDGFVDEAVHVIDALNWMIGPVHAGHAVTGNALGWPVDDHGAALLHLANGAIGLVEAGWTDTRMRLELDVVGATAAISLRDGEMTLTPRGASAPAERLRLDPLDAGTGILPFLDALDGRRAPALVPAAEAARVNAVLDDLGLRLT
ncbi:Gfo/Idh/MocA family protein [Anianabacter salinae]|uniref:Gfo/Idh/MocA family protein n=1 Tax=Anianabacter salinae TaxID=2851023 RepID=UPI00225DFDC8|nr:Gfo/Idh/MocA family oxidoreductase [Anianabacter salinae]MBV0912794.1 Gfo/Idh/MocA family oxidoreductase [Anianabacter salinae]